VSGFFYQLIALSGYFSETPLDTIPIEYKMEEISKDITIEKTSLEAGCSFSGRARPAN
jgi:hypothetical protein